MTYLRDIHICARCGVICQDSHACSGEITAKVALCPSHQIIYWGASCQMCDQAEMRQHRDLVNVLEARISDQDSQIAGLRRQINVLEHIAQDLQRAHNALVDHIAPNPDLLP